MANTDYSERVTGSFCTVAKTVANVSAQSTSVLVTDVREVAGQPLAAGALLLIENEFMVCTSLTGTTMLVKRGCLDTVPQDHPGGVTIFVVGNRVASDFTEYLGTETLSLKLLSKTTSGTVPIAYAPPQALTFGQRFARPYPPAQVRVNGQHWRTVVTMDDNTQSIVLTWVERNRIVQADAILGHADAGVAAEVGTTYTVKLYTDAGTLVRTISGLTGTTWTYTFAEMVDDFGLAALQGTGIYTAYLTFGSVRDGHQSWQGYAVPLALDTADIADPSATLLLASMRSFWEFEENDASTVFVDRKAAYPMNVRNTSGALATSSATNTGLVDRAFYPNDVEGVVAYIPVAANFKLPNASWTFGAWMTGHGGSGGTTKFLLGNVGSDATQFQAYLSIDSTTDTIQFNATTNGAVSGRVSVNSGGNLDSSVMTLVTATLDRTANMLIVRRRRVGTGAMSSAQAAFPGALYTGTTTANWCVADAMSSDGTYFSGTRHGLHRVDQAFIVDRAITDQQFDYLFNAGAGKSWAQIQTDAT